MLKGGGSKAFSLNSCSATLNPDRQNPSQDVINTDGDNEETWEKFDTYFTRPALGGHCVSEIPQTLNPKP